MKTLFALALLAAGLGTSGAWAAGGITIRTNTAGELAENCGANPREPGADARINFCRGFAQGAIDVELRHAGDKKPFCFPALARRNDEPVRQLGPRDARSPLHAVVRGLVPVPGREVPLQLGIGIPCQRARVARWSSM
jgi:hypothetical protein